MLHHEAMENITSFLPQIKIFESLPAEIIREIEQLVTRAQEGLMWRRWKTQLFF